MIQNRSSAKFRRFLVDPTAALGPINFQGDPILYPIGETLVAFSLGIDEVNLSYLINTGLLSRTCAIEIGGQKTSYYCNYWDLLQAAASCSLIGIGLHSILACDFAENLCDFLAFVSEDSQQFEVLDLDGLVSVVDTEVDDLLSCLGLQIVSYGREAIVAKVAIDLLNASTRFTKYLSGAAPQEPSLSRISGDVRTSPFPRTGAEFHKPMRDSSRQSNALTLPIAVNSPPWLTSTQ